MRFKTVTVDVPNGTIVVRVEVRHGEFWQDRVELRDPEHPAAVKALILKIGSHLDEDKKLLFYRRLPDALAALFLEDFGDSKRIIGGDHSDR